MPHRDDLTDVDVALMLVRAADQISTQRFTGGRSTAQMKSDGTPVTPADLAVEIALIDLLTTLRPLDGILSEETGRAGAAHSGRTWILDPIDGTAIFLSGGSNWGTHICLQDGQLLRLGIISSPVHDSIWICSADNTPPLMRNGSTSTVKASLSRPDDCTALRVAGFAEPTSEMRRQSEHIASWVDPPCGAMQALLSGDLDAVIDDGGQIWDIAPRAMMIRAAGGVYSDPDGGERMDMGGALYCVNSVTTRFRATLRGARTTGTPVSKWR